jgi:hypothetical protein
MCLGEGEFPMSEVVDVAGNPWHNAEARKKQLNTGVAGAHCCLPIQCEKCWMNNLEGRDPGPGDDFYVKCIRRATLDAIAGKSPNTIKGHKNRTLEIVRNAEHANRIPKLQPRGPFMLDDNVGMGLMVDILIKSVIATGRNEAHVQAETLRQLRGTYTKNWDSSPVGVAESASFGRGTGRVRPTACPTQSEFFADAWRGLESRMGSKSKANHGTTVEVLKTVCDNIAFDAEHADTVEEANELWKIGAFLCLSTAGSLRGYETFYMDLEGIRKYIDVGKNGVLPKRRITKSTLLSEKECQELPHVVIPLLGKFKGDNFIDHHLINVASETMSGLRPRWWMEKLFKVLKSEGRTEGPAFATPDGKLASSTNYDSVFRSYLKQVQATTDLIKDDEDIDNLYGISRTPRKTAVTRSKRAGYTKEVDEMNRWRTVENAKGRKAKVPMNVLYAEAVLMMPITWRVSYVL